MIKKIKWNLLVLCLLNHFLIIPTGQAETLKNYPGETWKSEVAKDVMLELIGFWDSDKNVDYVSVEQEIEILGFLYLKLHTNWVQDLAPRTNDIRFTGPFLNGVGYNTHQRVRVYYSNGVVNWLQNDRQEEIPDGAMIVKEMYPTDPNSSYGGDKVTGWAVMIRDSKATKDGWLWYLFFLPGTPSYGNVMVMMSQYGTSYCLSCHQGVDNTQGTYASIGNLNGKGVIDYAYINNPTPMQQDPSLLAGHGRVLGGIVKPIKDLEELKQRILKNRELKSLEAKLVQLLKGDSLYDLPEELFQWLASYLQQKMANPLKLPLQQPNSAITNLFGKQPVAAQQVQKIPINFFYDVTVAKPDHLDQFITSWNCKGCHDASLLLGGRLPAMKIEDQKNIQYNLSPFGEWSTSMMGLSGRDPIFLAQLESELNLRPQYKDYISNLCLSCHQVMGQRQFHLDGHQEGFTSDYTYQIPQEIPNKYNDANKYGSLARDGVSCTVCHQITSEGLGDPSTFTGQFHVNTPPGTVYGPYPTEELKPLYMKRALGIEPKYGQQIKNPALCGSCHTVQPPVLPLDGKQSAETYPISHEQTTYLEWVNSDYNQGNQPETCQDCHMPNTFRDSEPLEFTIANVQDGNFPMLPTRGPFEEITPEPKADYHRHTLVAINTFGNQFFQQFSDILGIITLNPGTGTLRGNTMKRLTLTGEEMLQMAQQQTVELSMDPVQQNSPLDYQVKVNIKNLAGHKFPSGVGFRRAFLQLKALDAQGNILWASGRTDQAGVLVDETGTPLPSEFTEKWQELQPNYNLIDDQSQVQIFESRHINLEGNLTTSFLGLAKEMKDNRLLPIGWQANGPYAKVTQPVSLGGNPFEPKKPGYFSVTYKVPRNAGEIHSFEANLMYQAIPPYYLKDRFETQGPSTERLYYLVSYMDLEKTPMANWQLKVASTQQTLQ